MYPKELIPIISSKFTKEQNKLLSTFPAEVRDFCMEMLYAGRSKTTVANYMYDFSLFLRFLKERELSFENVSGKTLKMFLGI